MALEIEKKYINFNFDISAYRLLGRELITDRITALFEIVKNAYDANANNVHIEFIEISSNNSNSKIIIRDDGIGMKLSDLKTKWMVIGTSSKRRNRVSPAPYNRKVVGKKGIGRFAVDLLGSKLTLRTKQKGEPKWVCLETDWTQYVKLENQQLKLPFDTPKEFFTDIKNEYWFEAGEIHEHGTILEIEKTQKWTKRDIERAYKELMKLVSPNFKITSKYPFHIKISSPFEGYEKVTVKPINVIEHATVSINLSYDNEKGEQQVIREKEGELIISCVPEKKFGFVEFTLYYFNQSAKNKIKKTSNLTIDGIKIYRDGIITTPFAEYESNIIRQKDILGIDKRRYSGFFDKISSNDLLGFVELKDDINPKIIEATNRQGFIENEEWRALKEFVIEQIEQIETALKYKKNRERATSKSKLGIANNDIKNIKKNISSIAKDTSGDVKKKLESVTRDLGKLQGTVNKSLKDYAKLEEETKQKENLYFSLVSLQTYAAMFSHMTKNTIGHVIRQAEYFNEHFPNESKNDRFKKIAVKIFNEFLTLRNGVDFMLKYAQSDNIIQEIDFNKLIDNLFNNLYREIFKREKIKTEINIEKNIILNYNKKSLEDIFDNLITNSIKALKGRVNKKISCSSFIKKNMLILYFSDNGIGIDDEDKYKIFDIFYTKTANEDGAGLGLYMVKTQIESMKGNIKLVESEFKTGATFEIILPFQK